MHSNRLLLNRCAMEPSGPSLGGKKIRSRLCIHVKQELFCLFQLRKDCVPMPRDFPRKVLGNVRLAIFEVVHQVNEGSKKLVRLVLSSVHFRTILFPSK